ncbi:MAG: hypothetical protein H6978_08955 [Gammaproteobacteria bacterium]|nr:hypothetical protein [Gammaproteobacteria bacterium]
MTEGSWRIPAFVRAFVRHGFSRRSLVTRLFLRFALLTLVIWLAVVAISVHSALRGGERELERDMRLIVLQVQAVIEQFADQPDGLAHALESVEALENSAEFSEGVPYRFQAWVDGKPLNPAADLPNVPPAATGLHHQIVEEKPWWLYSSVSDDGRHIVRVSIQTDVLAALTTEQWAYYLTPLVISLPLLILPSWFMVRNGIQPLNRLAGQVDNIDSGGRLTPLAATPYRELDPIVTSTNHLIDRLHAQLQRERGFIADIAHEIKTPLAIVRSNAELLQATNDPERRNIATADMKTGLQRADHLLRQLLSVARLEHDLQHVTATVPIDLAEFVRERIGLFSSLARTGGKLMELDTVERLPVELDIDAFAMIIDNLLDNAIKYSPAGGTISVSLLAASCDQIELVVADTGPGMSAVQIAQACERFQRIGDHHSDGVGLGLFIVRKACSRLGATLHISTRESGIGLMATVTLPSLPAAFRSGLA